MRCCNPRLCSARIAPIVIRFWPAKNAVGGWDLVEQIERRALGRLDAVQILPGQARVELKAGGRQPLDIAEVALGGSP